MLTGNVFSQDIGVNRADLENDFSEVKLNTDKLDAFEFRAKQKVIDFCNYISLISNKDYDEKLRLHSKETAIELFDTENCAISDHLIIGGESSVNLNTYFDLLLNSDYHKIIGEAEGIVLMEGLRINASGDYVGLIKYKQVLHLFDEKGKLLQTDRTEKMVNVVLSRKKKKFGQSEKTIWIVSLCDIISVDTILD